DDGRMADPLERLLHAPQVGHAVIDDDNCAHADSGASGPRRKRKSALISSMKAAPAPVHTNNRTSLNNSPCTAGPIQRQPNQVRTEPTASPGPNGSAFSR